MTEQESALWEAEIAEQKRRADPALLINILAPTPPKRPMTMAQARRVVSRVAVKMLSDAAAAFVDPAMGPDAATMKAAYEELVARVGRIPR